VSKPRIESSTLAIGASCASAAICATAAVLLAMLLVTSLLNTLRAPSTGALAMPARRSICCATAMRLLWSTMAAA